MNKISSNNKSPTEINDLLLNNNNFIQKYQNIGIIKHIDSTSYNDIAYIIYDNKFYKIEEVKERQLICSPVCICEKTIAHSRGSIDNKITINTNDKYLKKICIKDIYEKVHGILNFCKDYNSIINFLNKRTWRTCNNIKHFYLDDSNIELLINIRINTNIKINTLNKIKFNYKKTHNKEFSIYNLFKNPYIFITNEEQYISFIQAEKIENYLQLNIPFNIKIYKKIIDIIINQKDNSFYMKNDIFTKNIKDYIEENNEEYKNYEQDIKKEIQEINYSINKKTINKKGNENIGFNISWAYKEYDKNTTRKEIKERDEKEGGKLIKWCESKKDPGFYINEYINYYYGKCKYITTKYFYNLEKELTQDLIKISKLPNYINTANEDIYELINYYEKNISNCAFDDDQKKAIINILNNNFSVLTGSPGTGKTHTVGCVLFIYRKLKNNDSDNESDYSDNESDYSKFGEEKELKISIMAPTGQAYNVVKNQIKNDWFNENISGTLHKILYHIFPKKVDLKSDYNIKLNDSELNEILRKSSFDFVISDESSMIDLILFKSILILCKKYNSKLLLIGDPNQFQPIGKGNPLFNIIKREEIFNINKLTTIHRQQGNDALKNIIFKMTQNIKINNSYFNNDLTKFIDISEHIDNFQNDIFLKKFLIDLLKNENLLYYDDEEEIWRLKPNTKFLCFNTRNDLIKDNISKYKYKFIFNTERINNILWDYYTELSGCKKEHIIENNNIKKKYRIGDQIIRTENDYNEKTMRANGEEAKIIDIDINKNEISIKYNTDKEYDKNNIIDMECLYEEFDLNYITGFHKSQGMGKETIVVFLEPNASYIKKRAIYTALSRSKNKLIVFGRANDLLNYQEKEDERISLFMHKIFY